jgi:hypothetical protein
MKTLYRLHTFSSESIRETEQAYARMAKKGWLLKKTGLFFLKYEKGEPENRKYRIALPEEENSSWLDDFPAKQAARYQAMGWEPIETRTHIQTFTAPANSLLPDLYRTPDEMQFLIKDLKRWRTAWVPLVPILLFLLTWVSPDSYHPYRRLLEGFWLHFFTDTGYTLFIASFILYVFFNALFGAMRAYRMKRDLLSGASWSGETNLRHPVQNTLKGICLVTLTVSPLLMGIQILQTRELPFPASSDVPILTAEILGLDEEWFPFQYDNHFMTEAPEIAYSASPFLQSWEAKVRFSGPHSQSLYLYQEVCRTRSPQIASAVASSLAWNTYLTYNGGTFEPFSCPGLDYAASTAESGTLEYILVKGSTVWHIWCPDPDLADDIPALVADLPE